MFLPKLADLSMLFIFEMPAVSATSRINNTLKSDKILETGVSNVQLYSYCGAWCTEYDGGTLIIISELVME